MPKYTTSAMSMKSPVSTTPGEQVRVLVSARATPLLESPVPAPVLLVKGDQRLHQRSGERCPAWVMLQEVFTMWPRGSSLQSKKQLPKLPRTLTPSQPPPLD